MRSGFSRSIGKPDNTQIVCPRASAIRTGKFQKLNLDGYGWVMGRGNAAKMTRKATLRWLFSMASHWPPQKSRQSRSAGWINLRLRLVSVEPGSACRILGAGLAISSRALCVPGCTTYCSWGAVWNVVYYQLVAGWSGSRDSGLWKAEMGNNSGFHRNGAAGIGSGETALCGICELTRRAFVWGWGSHQISAGS